MYECKTYCDRLKISLQSSQLSLNVIARESYTQTIQEMLILTLIFISYTIYVNFPNVHPKN